MRTALEQRRAALLKAQADAARGEVERKLSKRYHKVKFFGACPALAAAALAAALAAAAGAEAARRSPAERKKIMKAQAKLRAEVEAQGWVRRRGRSGRSANPGWRLLSCLARAGQRRAARAAEAAGRGRGVCHGPSHARACGHRVSAAR